MDGENRGRDGNGNPSVVKSSQRRNVTVCPEYERSCDRDVDFPPSAISVEELRNPPSVCSSRYGFTPKNVRSREEGSFSSILSLFVNREGKRKQRKTTAEKELLFSFCFFFIFREERERRESKDFWFVLFSSGESVFWPTRGYIHSSLSRSLNRRRTAGGRPPARR